MKWSGVQKITSRNYRCGHCGAAIASDSGYLTDDGTTAIYICHFCSRPTFITPNGFQVPGSLFGDTVCQVTDVSIANIYDEARRAYSATAYTATVLCCRKLLMHIAVAAGAKEGERFVEYVEYLAANNFIPPGARVWVDHIRAKGNEANHEIHIASKEDAEDLVLFSEMLLKIIYEFPARAQSRVAAAEVPPARGAPPTPT
jgi:DNA-directed RNA polymerase subunit RPC12/RpoP